VRVTGLQQGQNTLLFRAEIPMIAASEWPYVQASVQVALPFMQRGFIQWLFWVAGILVLGFGAYLRLRQKKEKELKALLHQTQLGTVQAQLNPHILFNLLSSLQNSINNRSKSEASNHLVRIARLIREVLELSIAPDPNARYPFPTISLDHETRFLENYLQLEAMQHSPNFQYEIRNEVAGDPARVFIPPLLVQPLAENAVIHGIKPNAGKAGFIRIVFREAGEDLVISVEDDGVGQSAASGGSPQLFRYRSRGGELLQKRLHLMGKLGFPAKWGISARPEGGTLAEIRIRRMGVGLGEHG
jgi:LytS/YehU family sensor histidine kinase